MKKILLSLLAVAALASCSKMDVVYDEPTEIGFKAVAGNMTKISGTPAGSLNQNQELGIWAFWDNDATAGAVADFTNYSDPYLVNALFAKKTSTSWGGSPTGYPWPVNGALVFAGYTTQGDNVFPTSGDGTKVSYDLETDKMTFTNYDNTEEFDLCWFGRTANSYNYRADGTSVPANLSHALTWITIKVYGEGTPIGNWTIKSMNLLNVVTKGTGVCTGTTTTDATTGVITPASATWTAVNTEDSYKIYGKTNNGITESHTITDSEVELSNNVIIPSDPLELVIEFKYNVGTKEVTESKTVNLKLNDNNTIPWVAGVHYTYTLKFQGNEILVAPSYSGWSPGSNYPVTVE